MNLTFSEAMLAAVLAGSPQLTDTQSASLQEFFGADPSDPATETPRVKLLKWLVYRRAIKEGQVSKETPIEAVNWQNIIQLLMTLLPILLKLLGG